MKPLPLPFVPLRLGSDAVSVKSLRCHICSVWPRCSPIFYCHEREVTRVFEIFENSLSQKLKLCIWARSKSRVQSILVVREVRFVARRVRFFWCAESVLSARGIVVLCLRGSDDQTCLLEAMIIFARGELRKKTPRRAPCMQISSQEGERRVCDARALRSGPPCQT